MSERKEKRRLRIAIFHRGFIHSGSGERIVLEEVMGLRLLLPLVIMLLNLYLVYPLFTGEYTQFPGSIESVFLADAKFIVENFPHISWHPFWYLGFPFYLTYQPVLPFTLALGKVLTGLSLSVLYRALAGIFYVLGAVGVYFLVRETTNKQGLSFGTALLYTLLPSISYTFTNTLGLQAPWRLVVLTMFGEGPHIWGLAATPFALLFFIRLLNFPEKRANWLLSLAFTLFILLTSLTAFFGFLFLILLLLLVEFARGAAKTKFLVSFYFGLFVAGLASFWYNFSFLKAGFEYGIGEGGGLLLGIYKNPILLLVTLVPLIFLFVSFGRVLLRRKPDLYGLVLGVISFVVLFFGIYGWFRYNLALIPLPFRTIPRLIPELELAFALFLAGLGTLIISFFAKRKRLIEVVLLGIYIGGGFLLLPSQVNNMRELARPHSDFVTTSEYQVSQWLSENARGSRIYATGTHAFWLNNFADVAQLRGGKGGDFGGLNPWWAHLTYQLYYGEDGELAVKWLKALGVKYIVVNFPESRVYYHDFKDPYKFERLLREAFAYQGDTVYEVPLKKESLALAVEKEKLGQVREIEDPSNGLITLDEERLDSYLAATEENPATRNLSYLYPKGSWRRLEVDLGDFDPGREEVLLRISYHPGWKAYQDGKRVPMKEDPIGFILVEPKEEEGKLTLNFSPTTDVFLGYLVTLGTVLLSIVFLRSSAPEGLAKNLKEEEEENRQREDEEA